MINLKSFDDFTMSEEAYFGKNNEFANAVDSIVIKIQDLFENYDGPIFDIHNINKIPEKMEIRKKAYALLAKLGKTIKDNINVQKMKMEFSNSGDLAKMSFHFIPFDDTLDNIPKAKYLEARKSVHDILQTKEGYRFKNPKGMNGHIVLDVCLFEPKSGFTSREVTAIIFHEVGHFFELIVYNLIEAQKDISVVSTFRCLNLMHSVNRILSYPEKYLQNVAATKAGTLPIYKLEWSPELAKLAAPVWKFIFKFTIIPMLILIIIMRNIIFSENKKINSKDIEKDLAEELKKKRYEKSAIKILRHILSFSKNHPKFITFITRLIVTIVYSSLGLIVFGFGRIADGFTILRYFKRIKFSRLTASEQFAEYFPAAYGLGPELSSAIYKAKKKDKKTRDTMTLGLMAYPAKYIPIFSTFFNLSYLDSTNTQSVMNGYDPIAKRIGQNIKTYERELRENKDLTKEDREEIDKQLKALKENYKTFRNDPEFYSFSMRFINNIVDSEKNKPGFDKLVKLFPIFRDKTYENNVLDKLTEMESIEFDKSEKKELYKYIGKEIDKLEDPNLSMYKNPKLIVKKLPAGIKRAFK